MKTEVGFNGAYAGERHQIYLINTLVERGDGGDPRAAQALALARAAMANTTYQFDLTPPAPAR